LIAGAALLVLFAQTADAQPRRGARLSWARGHGADECVGTLGLQEDVKARLGWDPFTAPSEIEIEGAIARTNDGFRADLTFRDRDGKAIGKRKVESRARDCKSVGEATAIAITLVIDPTASGVAAAAIEPEPTIEPAPPPPPPPPPRERVRVVLSGGITSGIVPGPSDVTSLRAQIVLGDFVELGTGFSWFREQREGDFAFGVVAGEVRACATPWRPSGLARLCGAFLAGAFEANVRAGDLSPVEVGSFPWAAAELGPVLSVGIAGPMRLELAASAIVPITRRQGFVRGATAPVWEESVVAGRAELGIGALF
jgi:hypothetical protein